MTAAALLVTAATLALTVAASPAARAALPTRAATPSTSSTRAQVVSAAAAYGRAHRLRIAVSVLDTKTGTLYAAGRHRATFASESVVKTMIAARLLATGRMHGRTARRAYRMITRSDDGIASSLYGRVGGDGLIRWVKRHWHVPSLGSRPRRSGWWGNTHITSDGLVRLYAKWKQDRKVGPWLINAMRHTKRYGSDGQYQFFGLPSAAKHPAVKQGWGTDYDDWGASANFNSTGFVNNRRYAVAILARGPARYYGRTMSRLMTAVARVLLPNGRFPDPTPELASVSPDRSAASGGAVVTLRGSSFTGVSGVFFGTSAAQSFTVRSAGTITAVAPAHPAGPAPVRVVTTHGSTVAWPFQFVAAPVVTSLAPSTGRAAGGTVVTLRGAGFSSATSVTFDGVSGTSVHVDSSEVLTVETPRHPPGRTRVVVVSPYGQSGESTAAVFTYTSS